MLESNSHYEKKERRLRKRRLRLFYGCFVVFIGYMFVLSSATIVTFETEFEGKILFTSNNHNDFYVFFWNDRLSFPNKTSLLEMHMRDGYFIKKEANAEIIKITNSDSTYYIKLKFSD